MPRERETFRDELVQLFDYFGHKETLTLSEVARYTGRSSSWCEIRFGVDKTTGIQKKELASLLASTFPGYKIKPTYESWNDAHSHK